MTDKATPKAKGLIIAAFQKESQQDAERLKHIAQQRRRNGTGKPNTGKGK